MAERKILAELIEGVEAMKKHRRREADAAELQSGSGTTPNEECPTLCKIKTAKGRPPPLSAKPLGCATRLIYVS